MLENKVGHHGTFRLHGHEVWGELIVSRSTTRLKLRTEGDLTGVSTPDVIHGRLHDFTLVSCVHCVGDPEPARAWNSQGNMSSAWDVFPHQILSGSSYFDPREHRILKVWFSTGDIYQIFDDFDAFGLIRDDAKKLYSLLPEKIGERQVPIGPEPKLVYFAGRSALLQTSLSFGKLEVQHWPSSHSDSRGARITTQMMVQIEFESPVELKDCLRKVANIAQFLSLVAGRSQGVENVQVAVEGQNGKAAPLSVHWPLGPEQAGEDERDTPSRIDMPLDGIRRPDEFKQTIARWFSTNDHDTARARLYSCLQAGNNFSVDRLVAAANIFDLTTALPAAEVTVELAEVRDNCLRALRVLPRSDDRDSAIMAMSRIGAPTLMKKALARAAVLRGHFHLEHLDKVLRQAIKGRNYFVHGPSDKGFNYAVVEMHMAFLTETLEFVFAAAELIDCGWSAAQWRLRPHTGRHWFSRFIASYAEESQALLSTLNGQNS
jgi:hypothetical protein